MRIEAILQMWEQQLGKSLPRPVCLEGDIAEPGLGLTQSDRQWIKDNCDRAIHNAAVLTFHGADPNGDPWRTNVNGTRNVLDACRELDISDLHYVSTAYVSGTRQGVIREDELDCGQDFRNDYEHSKLLAEKMVREADFLRHVTVYRPAVIAGDSKTGYTNTYHGVYTYLKLFSVIVWNLEPEPDGRRYTPLRLNMNGDERRNVVPADWVSAVLCRLIETPEARGGTYHLAPEAPMTPRDLIEAAYTYYNSYGVQFCGQQAASDFDRGPLADLSQDHWSIYQAYEATDPTFDTANMRRFAADIPCPKIDQAMLHRFWKYGEADRWGKRREPHPAVQYRIADHLSEALTKTEPASGPSESESGGAVVVGLDISGPGGGQWKVTVQGSRVRHLDQGLPLRSNAILRMSTEDWQQLSRAADGTSVDLLSRHFETVDWAPLNGLSRSIVNALFPNSEPSDRTAA